MIVVKGDFVRFGKCVYDKTTLDEWLGKHSKLPVPYAYGAILSTGKKEKRRAFVAIDTPESALAEPCEGWFSKRMSDQFKTDFQAPPRA